MLARDISSTHVIGCKPVQKGKLGNESGGGCSQSVIETLEIEIGGGPKPVSRQVAEGKNRGIGITGRMKGVWGKRNLPGIQPNVITWTWLKNRTVRLNTSSSKYKKTKGDQKKKCRPGKTAGLCTPRGKMVRHVGIREARYKATG